VNSDLHFIVVHGSVIGIAFVLPIWDFFEARRLRQSCTSADRLRYYRAILAFHWILSVVSIWALGWGHVLDGGGMLGDATLALANPVLRFSLLGLAVAGILLALAPSIYSLWKPEKIQKAYRRALLKSDFNFLVPRTPIARRYFAVMCVSAGVCEEIIFRSFLVAYFHSAPYVFPVFMALLASSVLFGINHGYQGAGGVVKTGIFGFLFGLLFLTTGSLVLAMVLHAATDLQAWYMLRPAAPTSAPEAAAVAAD
jgi:membrane protease YdiL (CAAX protease family)